MKFDLNGLKQSKKCIEYKMLFIINKKTVSILNV